MSGSEKPVELSKVECETCLKEIPKSEAKVSEAGDYIVYFCGLDCYEKWQDENDKPDSSNAGSNK